MIFLMQDNYFLNAKARRCFNNRFSLRLCVQKIIDESPPKSKKNTNYTNLHFLQTSNYQINTKIEIRVDLRNLCPKKGFRSGLIDNNLAHILTYLIYI